jgi:hypothetical protein
MATSPKASSVTQDGLVGDFGQADALDGRRRAEEVLLDELAGQADRVKDLGTAIGLVGRDAHLGHDLQDALVDRLDVALDDFVLASTSSGKSISACMDSSVSKGQIRVDGFGAITCQDAEMMHFAGFTGLDDKPTEVRRPLRIRW